jgi:hypothetical protein
MAVAGADDDSRETTMGKVGKLVAKEVREAIPPFLFFLVLFHLIGLSKAVLVEDYSFTSLRGVVATIGALIVAKAILVVEALPLSRVASPALLVQILWKTVLFTLMALLFHVLEELIPLFSKEHGFGNAVHAYVRDLSWPHMAITALWLLAGLFLYCTCWELVKIVGPDEFKKRLLGKSGAETAE